VAAAHTSAAIHPAMILMVLILGRTPVQTPISGARLSQ
jgi:hypothetical protein